MTARIFRIIVACALVCALQPHRSLRADDSSARTATAKPTSTADSPAPDTPIAEPSDPAQATTEEILEGHSSHGEVFNEGPRQAAYLMPGLGRVDFPVSTTQPLAQRFFEQGVAQLHGFWYYEAERSFRQAAVHDPDCAMCYWGMAQANVENRQRARDFIAQAIKRREAATHREQLYIDAFQRFLRDEDEHGKSIEKKERAQRFTRDLEELVEEFPDDIEARALLALQLWQNDRADLPIVSHVAIDSVLQDVFDANPLHPAHHYRIHLWDKQKPERALASAALCGESLPAIAHMWHMPGHIYSGLQRYQDAVWQQEASARVDHAHMMRDRVLPDQIHNFAHNNEWLIRNLIKIGRVNDALSLARNMISLPRHPKLNTPDKFGSARLGRERLLLTLTTYRLWPELIAAADAHVLEASQDPKTQIEHARYVGIAYALGGQAEQAANQLSALKIRLDENSQALGRLTPERLLERPPHPARATKRLRLADEHPPGPKWTAAEFASQRAAQKTQEQERVDLDQRRQEIDQAVAAVEAAGHAANQEWVQALALWDAAKLSDELLKSEWLAAAGQFEEAIKLLDKKIASDPNEVPSHAIKSWLLYEQSGVEGGRDTFELTRKLACTADLDTPLLARLRPLADELSLPAQWAAPFEAAVDFGPRPALDSLGPFRWHPYMAPDFVVRDPHSHEVHRKQFSGRPTLVIFYLGFGCLHCMEQLHAFSPRVDDFQQAGINVLAISTEDVQSLNTGLADYSDPLKIPLHADPEMTAFKAYRCFDDFEQQPLHGTFLIDPDGRVLWQDVGYEPFMDVQFVLDESQRLLRLAR